MLVLHQNLHCVVTVVYCEKQQSSQIKLFLEVQKGKNAWSQQKMIEVLH